MARASHSSPRTSRVKKNPHPSTKDGKLRAGYFKFKVELRTATMSSPPPSSNTQMEFTADDAAAEHPAFGGRYKSYRKKWRKMRVQFERAMETANDMFIREHKAWDIAKRLQEQNDQLLDIVQDLELDAYPERHGEDTWQQSVPDAFHYTEIVSTVPHTAVPSIEDDDEALQILPDDLHGLYSSGSEKDLPPGFLTTTHEAQYLDALDAALALNGAPRNLPPPEEPGHLPFVPPREKYILRESDFSQTHPTSVHNWLRKNKPDMFADKSADKNSERSGQSPAPASKSAKKKAADKLKEKEKEKEKQDAPFESLDEDIGYDAALDLPAGGKNKRKREDESYRPKGGSSRAAAATAAKKRRRTKDDVGVDEGKRADGDGVATPDNEAVVE